MPVVHQSKQNTYHTPNPTLSAHATDGEAWTIVDNRGIVTDQGVECENCGACDDMTCKQLGVGCEAEHLTCRHRDGDDQDDIDAEFTYECHGLVYYFLCLDGGEVLCGGCSLADGIELMDCDCLGQEAAGVDNPY